MDNSELIAENPTSPPGGYRPSKWQRWRYPIFSPAAVILKNEKFPGTGFQKLANPERNA